MNRGRRFRKDRDMDTQSDSDDIDLALKVKQLEATFRTFRAEVNLKLSIVEEILSTRNEQFGIEKKLLEKEASLYQRGMSRWANTTLDDVHSGDGDSASEDIDPSPPPVKQKKRPRRRTAPKRTKIATDEEAEDGGSSEVIDMDYDPITQFQRKEDQDGNGLEKIHGQEEDPEVEKVVFIDVTTQPRPKGGRTQSGIWTHFLKEENGNSALCKLCEVAGVQKILQMSRGVYNLLRHMRHVHPEVAVENESVRRVRGGSRRERVDNDSEEEDGNEITNAEKNGRKSQSPVWNYFTKSNNPDSRMQNAVCNLCQNEGEIASFVLRKGSTTALVRHLETVHHHKKS